VYHMTLPLLCLAAIGLTYLTENTRVRMAGILIGIALVVQWLSVDHSILTNMANARIPHADLEQYINGWPSGSGLKEIIQKLQTESEHKKIMVYSEGSYGSLPTTTLSIYLGDNPNIKINPIDPIPPTLPEEVLLKAENTPTYILLNKEQETPNWPVKTVMQFQKGSGDSYIRLYEVIH
jgi:hypothetical protein